MAGCEGAHITAWHLTPMCQARAAAAGVGGGDCAMLAVCFSAIGHLGSNLLRVFFIIGVYASGIAMA